MRDASARRHYSICSRSIGPRPLAYVLAIVFLAAGIGLGSWARLHLKRRGTPVDPRRPTTALVTDGPYRYSRNPLYLRVTLLYLSFAFLVNDIWFVAVLPLVLIVLHVGVISREERYLEARFGDDYRACKANVRRWL